MKKYKYHFEGEVVVQKRSVFIVSPNLREYFESGTEIKLLYLSERNHLLKDLNRLLMKADGKSISIFMTLEDKFENCILRKRSNKHKNKQIHIKRSMIESIDHFNLHL